MLTVSCDIKNHSFDPQISALTEAGLWDIKGFLINTATQEVVATLAFRIPMEVKQVDLIADQEEWRLVEVIPPIQPRTWVPISAKLNGGANGNS
jgi:hypothetical protein